MSAQPVRKQEDIRGEKLFETIAFVSWTVTREGGEGGSRRRVM